jgi:hypothetical protein
VDTRGLGTFTLADDKGGSAPEELLDTLQQGQDQGPPPADSAAAAPRTGRRK